MIKISKGLDLPISGTPICEVEKQLVRSIGILGSDYPNLKPKMHVNIGDTVGEGDVLCVIEAMKLFNEIESDVSGKIVKILVEDASPVEFDQPLFLVDPS